MISNTKFESIKINVKKFCFAFFRFKNINGKKKRKENSNDSHLNQILYDMKIDMKRYRI